MQDIAITLLRLAFVSIVLMVALEQIFETKLYQKYLGKGENGDGSKIFKHFELRPWLSMLAGVIIAFKFGLTCLSAGLGPAFISASQDANQIDMFLTGLIIGGGTKPIKKIYKESMSFKKEMAA